MNDVVSIEGLLRRQVEQLQRKIARQEAAIRRKDRQLASAERMLGQVDYMATFNAALQGIIQSPRVWSLTIKSEKIEARTLPQMIELAHRFAEGRYKRMP